MAQNKANRLLFAYFQRPKKEYVQTVKSIKASGGLSDEEIEEIRAEAPAVHAEAILRHLTASK